MLFCKLAQLYFVGRLGFLLKIREVLDYFSNPQDVPRDMQNGILTTCRNTFSSHYKKSQNLNCFR